MSSSSQGETRLACLVCRQRKVACDRRRPKCSLCEKNNFDCQYKSRQHRPGLRAGYVQRLEQQLNDVEGRLRQVEAQLASGHNTTSNAHRSRSITQPSPRPHFSGDAEQSISDDMLQNSLIDEDGEQNNAAGSVPYLRTSPRGRHPDLSPDTFEAHNLSPSPEEWPFAMGTKFLDIWFQKYNAWFPIMHESSLQDSANPKYELVQKAIAVVVISHDVEVSYRRAQVIGNLRDEIMRRGISESSMQSIQALLILSNCYFAEGQFTEFWNILAICKKMAMHLDLHVASGAIHRGRASRYQEARSIASSNFVQRQEAIRTFWMIEMLDSISTLGLNNCMSSFKLPPTALLPCLESIWALREPAIEQHSPDQLRVSSGFSLCVLLAVEELGAIHQFLQKDYDFTNLERQLEWQSEAQRLDERLTNWREEFVAAVFRLLNAEKEQHPRAEMEPFITLTNCVLNTAIIILLQQMAPFPKEIGRDFEPWAFATSRCIYACENMAAKVRRIGVDQLDSQSPHLIFPIFVAARFYVAYSKALDADVPANLHSLAFNLHICGKRWGLAQRYEAIIRTAVAEHRSPISECVLPVEFYDLRYSTLEITDLLQSTAQKLNQHSSAPDDGLVNRNWF